PEPAPPPELAGAREADRARAAAATTAPQPGAAGRDRRAPAPDRGDGAGVPRAAPAFRRDTSTLHERITDGAATYQASHERTTARAPSSPEAVRREPETGTGDSARTLRPRRAPTPAAYGESDPRQPGEGSPAAAGVRAPPPEPEQSPVGAPAARVLLASSDGPLDADRGARSFDVAARGRAADDDAVRAAADETRPGITDFTRAATPGRGSDGRGAGEAPGATPRPAPGLAASLPGAPDAAPGPTPAERAR